MPELRCHPQPVLQDVLARLDKTYQAFFRRVKAGKHRASRASRPSSLSRLHLQGVWQRRAIWIMAFSSRQNRAARRPLEPPMEGTLKTVTIRQEADGWYMFFSCEGVPIQQLSPTNQETAIDLGVEAFATLADGTCIANPRLIAGRAAPRKPSGVSHVARKGASADAKRCNCSQGRISTCGGSARTFTTRPRSPLCASTTPSITKTCRRSTCSRTTTWPSRLATLAGVTS